MSAHSRLALFGEKWHLLLNRPTTRPKPGICLHTPSQMKADQTLAIFAAWQAWMRDPAVQRHLESVTKRLTILEAPLSVHGRTYLVKAYVYRDIPRILEKLAFASDARRNFATLCFLSRHGILVSPPVSLILETVWGMTKQAFVLTECIPDAVDYKEFLSVMDDQPEENRHVFFSELGKALAGLHKLDIATRDTDKNVMVESRDQGFRFHFLDFDCAYPWVRPNLRRTTRTIRKFLTPGHRFLMKDIKTFIDSYATVRGCPHWTEAIFTECSTYVQAQAHRYKN